MTVFEEKLRNFVLKGIPFEHTSASDVKVVGNSVYGTQTITLSFDSISTFTLACKPAFSDVWLFSYDYVDGETENYVESVLHRILSKHRKNFQYL